MQKDNISARCLQLFKKYCSVGSVAFFMTEFVKTRIKWVPDREDEGIMVLWGARNSPRRIPEGPNLSAAPLSARQILRNCRPRSTATVAIFGVVQRKWVFEIFPIFLSFQAIWELIFGMASLRYQGLSNFHYWQTHLGPCSFFKSTELFTVCRLTSV